MTSSSMRSGEHLLRALERDLPHVARLDPPTCLDLIQAIIELCIARIRLSTRRTHELLNTKQPLRRKPPDYYPVPTALIDRVSFAISRMGNRVPWRADCLVQALAAQRWLARRGVSTALVVGVRKPAGNFEAHAWLTAGDRVVTGGEIGAYNAILQQPPTE